MLKPNRLSAWIAWSLCAVTVALAVATIPLLFANSTQIADVLSTIPAFLAFAVGGALIVTHQPRNRIGWIYCVIGSSAILYGFALEYAAYALITHPHSLPWAMLMAWLGHDWTGSIAWFLLVLVVPLLFPDGRLPTPGWRIYAYPLGLLLGLALIVSAFRTTPMNDVYPQIPNPLGFAWADRLAQTIPNTLSFLCPFISFASLVVRYRRAQTTERQQIKWLAYAAALIPLAVVLTALSPGLQFSREVDYWLSILFWTPVYSALPVATGIAILRYRLYDIDRLISRTLGYGVLTTLLVLLYFGSVVVLGMVSQNVLGLASSQLVAVFSTLLIAALFTPLRRRVQEEIDRRFYRRKYDAEQVLARFATTVREETDLEQLAAHLLQVVEETLQPTQRDLWLRKTERR